MRIFLCISHIFVHYQNNTIKSVPFNTFLEKLSYEKFCCGLVVLFKMSLADSDNVP